MCIRDSIDPGIEELRLHLAGLQKVLQGRGVGQPRRGDRMGGRFQRLHALGELGVDLCGEQRDRGELVPAQLILHLLTQDAARCV